MRPTKSRAQRNHIALSSLHSLDQGTVESSLMKTSLPDIQAYCKWTGRDIHEFTRGVSYSYWRHLGGLNRSIVADSAIRNRYHIFSEIPPTYGSYLIVDNGEVVLKRGFIISYPNNPTSFSKDDLKNIHRRVIQDWHDVIGFYEKIRNTPGFNPEHCYLVEFQTDQERHHFLQCHRTRDANIATWTLPDHAEEKYMVPLVRGATLDKNGVVVNITEHTLKSLMIRTTAPESEQAGVDAHYNKTFKEIMSRRRGITVIPQDLGQFAWDISRGSHTSKSILFNPEISVLIPYEYYSSDFANVRIKIVSDGRKAYVEFMDK